MKKFVLALSSLCIVTLSSQAQKLTPGIKGGLNFADVTNLDGDDRLSGHIGLFLHSRINPRWAIQPEILYSGEGQKYMVINHEYALAFSYLQVPVMFQFYPVKQFYLEFGPQLGFLLSAKVKDDNNKIEVDDTYKKVAASLCFGAGFQVTNMLGFYARYNLGLSDITKGDNRDIFNRVGQIGVAVKLK